MKRTAILCAPLMLLLSAAVHAGPPKAVYVATGPVTLSDCYRLANDHYEPLKLVKMESNVAGWKLAETTRNLYPSFSVKAEETRGEADVSVGTPNFTEQSYGLHMTYPIFEGGKSWANRKQARSNYDISVIKYRKTYLEMRYNVQEAFWNAARLKANIREYQAASDEIQKLYERSRKLFQQGVIPERELLAIESQANQAAYQLDSVKADLENYSWTLADAVGLRSPLDVNLSGNLPFEEIGVNVEECLALAETHNPDIAMQKETAEAARYGAQVKKGYRWPRVDLAGFYGRSGGAYENEELRLSEDYQVNVQLTQFFLLNTISGSGIRQRTSPKLGQSARTELATVSGSFNILDGYKMISEEKEAVLSWKQAAAGLDKTTLSVKQEVREAYFNYRKALAQVRNTRVDKNIAEKELAISRINAGGERSSLSGVTEAINKLAGAKAALNEAKAFYLVSLAALNKAVGVENKFIIE